MDNTELELWNGFFPRARIEGAVGLLKERSWKRATYCRRAALVSLDDQRLILYTGQVFDPSTYKIVERGWTHDHCALCNWSVGESDDPKHGIGYTDGSLWLCTGCFEQFFMNLPPDQSSSS